MKRLKEKKLGHKRPIYMLSKKPEIVEKIREEVDAVIGDKIPTFEIHLENN